MPTPESEPEKYSIDEMMDRLKSNGGGPRDGEAVLVTREDGTQVYRVRKRKRRSQQPKKEKEKRTKRFRIFQLLAAVGLVVFVGVSFFASLVYLNSSAYREKILGRIQAWTGAEAKLTKLRVTPVSAGADGLELQWPEDSMLGSLELHGIRGSLDFMKLVGGVWHGPELHANAGSLVLRPPGGKGLEFDRPEGEMPFQFRYRAANFTVLMGDEESPDFVVRNCEAEVQLHDKEGKSSHLVLKGGTLGAGRWGNYTLAFASFQIEPSGIRVGSIRLVPPGGGKGEIEILNPDKAELVLAGGETRLRAKTSAMPLQALLGESFGSWLSSVVETPEGQEPGEVVMTTVGTAKVSGRIPFRATVSAETAARGLPMFDLLAEEMGEEWYRRPVFDLETKGTVVLEEGRKGLEDLLLDARGRLSISGQVYAAPDGKLEGELNQGLPAAGVASGSPGLQAVFEKKGGGFAWAKVKISGTGARPMDDLAEQMKAAATAPLPASGGEDELDRAFKDLTTPGR